MKARSIRRWGVQIVMAVPLAMLLWRWGHFLMDGNSRAAGLTAEPIDYTINYLGLWTLRSLWLTLTITPLRRLTRWNWLAPLRRPIGLWCFAYAAMHLSVYFGLDLLASVKELWKDVVKHNFILFGMAAFTLLLPLALTSTHGWIRRLGAKNWQRLHMLIYPAAILASIHFIMRVKGFQWEPWIYAGVLALLLFLRWFKIQRRTRRA